MATTTRPIDLPPGSRMHRRPAGAYLHDSGSAPLKSTGQPAMSPSARSRLAMGVR